MRDYRIDIIAIIVLTLILDIILGISASGTIRIVLGLPFVLFFPGYTLIAALFPKKNDLDGIERVALSIGLSIAVVPLIGLILNYTPWGIRLAPIAISTNIFILAMSAITLYRRQTLLEEHRFAIQVNRPSLGWDKMGVIDKVLSVVLIFAIVGAVAALGYVIATPKVGEKFTELSILGTAGKAEGYPKEIEVGEEARVILGITNREHDEVTYHVEARWAGVPVPLSYEGQEHDQIELSLVHDEKWEKEVAYRPQEPSDESQKLQFLLWNTDKESEEERHDSAEAMSSSVALSLERGEIVVTNNGEEQADYQVVVIQKGAEVILSDLFSLDSDDDWEITFYSTAAEEVEVWVYKNESLIFSNIGAYLSVDLEEEQGSILVVNDGLEQADYEIIVRQGRNELILSDSFDLAPRKQWETAFEFSSLQDVEVWMYKDGTLIFDSTGDYLSVHLWIDVKEA